MSEVVINSDNLHEYMIYEVIAEKQNINIYWDCENTQLNDLIEGEFNELLMPHENYFNGMWVNQVKDMVEWEVGKNVGFSLDHYMIMNKVVIFQFKYLTYDKYNIIIDDRGYLCVKPIDNNFRSQYFVRCNCLYNDLLDQETTPYIFK